MITATYTTLSESCGEEIKRRSIFKNEAEMLRYIHYLKKAGCEVLNLKHNGTKPIYKPKLDQVAC